MRLPELESITVRQQLADAPDSVLAHAQNELLAAGAKIIIAESALAEAREKRVATTNRIIAYSQELTATSNALINSRRLALDGDVGTAWREADRNARRKKELQLLLEYEGSWIGPADAVVCLEAEIELEACRANAWEAEAVLQRCRIFIAAVDAREIDGNVRIDLSGSASEILLKKVERSRRQLVPEMEGRLAQAKERLEAANAASTIFV